MTRVYFLIIPFICYVQSRAVRLSICNVVLQQLQQMFWFMFVHIKDGNSCAATDSATASTYSYSFVIIILLMLIAHR